MKSSLNNLVNFLLSNNLSSNPHDVIYFLTNL